LLNNLYADCSTVGAFSSEAAEKKFAGVLTLLYSVVSQSELLASEEILNSSSKPSTFLLIVTGLFPKKVDQAFSLKLPVFAGPPAVYKAINADDKAETS